MSSASHDTGDVEVVALGASAGGLAALEAFFSNAPVDSGCAFVVIQHLSPDFDSQMVTLLSRKTPMPVVEAGQNAVLRPNTVYLMPPRKVMIVSGGRLHLTDKDPDQSFPLPIDRFLRSLAQDAGPHATAVILSGTGSDGSRGAVAIHEAGGVVISQQPETATFDGMPRAAIATEVVDLVLAPAEIPAAILELRSRSGVGEDAEKAGTPAGLPGLLRLLRLEHGIDFRNYKSTTVRRRVERRIEMSGMDGVRDYVEYVRNDAGELDALYRDLLIGVTRFFRDSESWERLARDVLPPLVRARADDGNELRVWVAGCATGEEAYSLAILLHECCESIGRPLPTKIFATDVHRGAVEIAGAGVYDDDALENVSEERRQRWFERCPGGHQVTAEIRQSVVVAEHDVLRDAPFTHLDMVACRNLLIYLRPPAQTKALSLFHFGLRSGGVLWLGASETPGELDGEFDTIDDHWRIYRKRRNVRLRPSIRATARLSSPSLTRGRLPRADSQLQSAYTQLLRRHVPPGMLVDESFELMHTFGGAERWLGVPGGPASRSILELVDDRLKTTVAGALRHASKHGSQRSVVVDVDDPDCGHERVKVTVEPYRDDRTHARWYLLRLEGIEETKHEVPAPDTRVTVTQASKSYIASLESELAHTRENLQATIEELETSNEELQAANEELVASNEELQSTNEELHSVNEELYTVNEEHQRKIQQLRETTLDLDNLLRSTQQGVLFLDRDLCVRRYTSWMPSVFRLQERDVGRRFDDIVHDMDYSTLVDDVEKVLDSDEVIERQVRNGDGVAHFLRVLPYRTQHGTDGVVITVVDVSALERQRERVRELSAIVQSANDAILGCTLDGVVSFCNRRAEIMFGCDAEEIASMPLPSLFPEDRRSAVEAAVEALRARRASGEPFESVVHNPREGTRDVSVQLSPIAGAEGSEITGLSASIRNISAHKQTERRLQRALDQREQLLAMLSHELRNPLAALAHASQLLTEAAPDGPGHGPAGFDPEGFDRAVATVAKETSHLGRILDDLLDLTRIQGDQIEMHGGRFDLCEAARAAAGAIERRFDGDLTVVVPDTGPFVVGDRDRIIQAVDSVLENAFKFSPEPGRVELSVETEADHAVIRVTDHGVGLAREMLEDVFQPFVQVVPPGPEVSARVGLGLSLARSIVESHGGTIRAESPGLGRGATITIRLPLGDAVAEESDGAERRDAVGDGSTSKRHVLVVEDREDTRTLLTALLNRRGYVTHDASDGLSALDVFEAEEPDAAIIDIGLPELDGFEVARRIRERCGDRRPRLIALTGFGSDKVRQKALDCGFDEHLVKPVDVDALLDALEAV